MAMEGPLRRLRRWTSIGLQLILFVTPWIIVAGNPALRLDLPGRRLYALGASFTPADSILLLLILLFLAFSLFFFTSLFGRLWCGYACPQTVFLEEWIRPLERLIEGPRGQWMHRDEAGTWPWSRVWRKATKWLLLFALAVVVSMTFTSFFAGARRLWSGQASPLAYAVMGFFALLWFFDFVWFREQFCNYLCPYARFQSAMTDEQTLLITYDLKRGEPRGVHDARYTGACIDCNKCVAVCPQGIDIRNGFQLECIACGACIDACDDVLGRLGHPGLMSYTSMAAAEGKQLHRVRPRTIAYAGLLTGIAAAWLTLLATRTPFEATVARAPGSLFTTDEDGFVRNTYLMRITNNTPGKDSATFDVRVEGLPDADVTAPETRLASAESRTVPVVIRVPTRDHLARTMPFQVHVASARRERVLDATFKTGTDEDDSQH
jgi:cytochrome c oxidase accessory protein FixG